MVFSVADGVLPSATFYELKGKRRKTKVFSPVYFDRKRPAKKRIAMSNNVFAIFLLV